MEYVLGADIGGSHITVAPVNLKNGSIVEELRCRVAVNANGDKQTIIENWVNAMRQVIGNAKFTKLRIGLAMPGPFDYERGISLIQEQEKFRSLYGHNLAQMLAQSLGEQPTVFKFINDAAAFVKGEAEYGVGQGKNKILALTLGTGLGGATYTNGTIADAEIWNLPFLDSIAEDYLSTRWFVGRCALDGHSVAGVKEMVDGVDDETFKMAVFNEFAENLASFLAIIANRYQPQQVILGGNIAQAYSSFANGLSRALDKHDVDVQLELSVLGESAALIGAASIWKNEA